MTTRRRSRNSCATCSDWPTSNGSRVSPTSAGRVSRRCWTAPSGGKPRPKHRSSTPRRVRRPSTALRRGGRRPSLRLSEREEPRARTGSRRLGVRVEARRSSNHSDVSSTFNPTERTYVPEYRFLYCCRTQRWRPSRSCKSTVSTPLAFFSRESDLARHTILHANAHIIPPPRSAQRPPSQSPIPPQ